MSIALQFQYIKIQLKAINMATRLWKLKKKGFHMSFSHKPEGERVNINLSKMGYLLLRRVSMFILKLLSAHVVYQVILFWKWLDTFNTEKTNV